MSGELCPLSGSTTNSAIRHYGTSAEGEWCGWGDLNPHGPQGPTDFLPTSAFAAAAPGGSSVRGLDYPFAMPSRAEGAGAARLVSTPSRVRDAGLARDRHLTGFPEFERFCSVRFRAGTQSYKSGASTIPPHPHACPRSGRRRARQVVILPCKGRGTARRRRVVEGYPAIRRAEHPSVIAPRCHLPSQGRIEGLTRSGAGAFPFRA